METWYAIGIKTYTVLLRILAMLGNPRAKKFIDGRKRIFEKISKEFKVDKKCVWFHFASLGEYEQGSPLMEYFLEADYKIVITFFSPSGYEIRKDNPFTPFTYYLPMDTSSNAKRFLDIVQPSSAVFTKYEFWHFYFKELEKRKIPLYLISGLFREDQLFFKWYGGFYREMLRKIKYIFVQNELSKKLLTSIGIYNVEVSGDTRFDKVLSTYKEKKSIPIVEQFLNGNKAIILGSSWKQEEELMFNYLNKNAFDKKIIVCPHDISSANIVRIKELYSRKFKTICLSEIEREFKEAEILIIDRIGILKYLYQYSDIAFIGGAFGAGLHNILEAVAFRNTVIFGPKYKKFPEAKELLQRGIGHSVKNLEEFSITIKKINKMEVLEKNSIACLKYVEENLHATEKIWSALKT